jgi:hypothetical protein
VSGCGHSRATAGGGKSAGATGKTTMGVDSGRQTLGGLVIARIGFTGFRVEKKSAAPHTRLGCIHLPDSFDRVSNASRKKSSSNTARAITEMNPRR